MKGSPMLVVDTSAFISLGLCDEVNTLLDEFEVHTSKTVIQELKETSEYDDQEAEVARSVLDEKEKMVIHDIGEAGKFKRNRIDQGEGSCAVLAREIGSDFLITDDIRALPYLENIASTRVAISPIVLKALVKRDVLNEEEAKKKAKVVLNTRDWFETPIYEKAVKIFKTDLSDEDHF